MTIEEARLMFIEYQKQFFTSGMYDQIEQSDQQGAIMAGKYDDYIIGKFKLTIV